MTTSVGWFIVPREAPLGARVADAPTCGAQRCSPHQLDILTAAVAAL